MKTADDTRTGRTSYGRQSVAFALVMICDIDNVIN